MISGRRDRFARITKRLARIFLFLEPNHITFLSLILAIFGFLAFISQLFIPAFLFYSFAALLDAIDGEVARIKGKASPKGAYLDTIADRYVEFLMLFGFLFVEMPPFILNFDGWLLLVLFGSLLTTYAKASAKEKMNKEVRNCLLERGERVIILLFSILLLNFDKNTVTFVFVLLAFLTNLSAFQRILKALAS